MNAVAPALQVGDAREAVALLQLLSGAAHGVVQSDDGSYAGARRRLQLAELRAHLAGEVTLGVSVVSETKATFLALDIDERFHERLPYVSRALEQRGFRAAAIATSGSDSGRGKVLVFFAKRRAATSLRSLGNAILKTAREMASGGPWGVERPGKMTVFPLNGTGGLLRIGGRNRHPSRRASGVDVLFSLDGEPRRFQDVVPAAALRRMDPQPIAKAPVGVWVSRLRSTGLRYADGGSKRVRNKLCRLASEAVRVHGSREIGHTTFDAWCKDVWNASPDQRGSSPSGDPRATRTWERRCLSAWEWAAAKDTFYYPERSKRSLQENVSTCRSCRRVLEMLEAYAAAKGMTPDAFCCSYRQIAEHLGFAQPMTAWKHVKHLVGAGAVVLHDRGTRGAKGLPVIFGIVGRGESAEAVLARGRGRANVRERLRIRNAYEAHKREYDDAKPGDFDRIEDFADAA